METEALDRLYNECERWFERNRPGQGMRLVFGDGLAYNPPLMLIGEAPGEQEALQGKPFVGKAGKNLSEFLTVLGLKRDEIYISNVVKFRPTRISAAGRTVNRPPTRTEITDFTAWLYREIGIVGPRAVVTLGNVALGAFCKDTVIGDCHGSWRNVTIPTETEAERTLPLFALYHPASIIYNRSLAEVYQNDLLKLKVSLAHSGGRTDG